MRRFLQGGALLLGGLLSPSWLWAACLTPMLHRNQLPPSALFLQLTPESACVLAPGEVETLLSVQHSNTAIVSFQTQDQQSSRFVVDHERQERTLRVSLGGPERWQTSLTVRHIEDSTGHWDSFMRAFHEDLNLPYTSRKLLPDYSYSYLQYNKTRYRSGDESGHLKRQTPEQGMGDVVLTLKRGHLPEAEEGWKWGLRLDVKAPWEREAPTLGSGNWDQGLGALLEGSIQRWHFLLNAGIVHLGKTEHTAFEQASLLFNGSVTVEWQLSETWGVSLQNLASSPRYVVSGPVIRGISSWESTLGASASWRSGAHRVTLGFTEDPSYNSSEDFSLILQWLRTF